MAAEFISVLLGGGFALAGTYLGPLMQRGQRREDRRYEHHALMRQQAERALVMIGNLRSNSNKRVKKLLSNIGEESADLNSLHDIYAITAVYFHKSLATYTKWREDTGVKLDSLTKDGKVVPDKELSSTLSDAIVDLCLQLEKEISEEVQQYIR